MSNLAINDAGDVLAFDGKEWKPAPTAQNDAGEKVVYDGSTWKPLGALVAAQKASKPQDTSAMDRSAVSRGLSFGSSDEIGSAVRATVGPAVRSVMDWARSGSDPNNDPMGLNASYDKSQIAQGSQAPTWGQRYEEELARTRAQAKVDKADSPNRTMAGEIVGNVAGTAALTALPVVGPLFRGGAGLAGNMIKGGIGGAALGGAQGFNEGEGGFVNRAYNAAIPAAIGLGAGVALPVVGKGIGAAYEKVAPWVLNKTGAIADKFAQQVPLKSLSAAAPEGTMVAQDGLASKIAGGARGLAQGIEEDAAIKRLAQAIASGKGVEQARAKLAALGEGGFIADTGKATERLANVGYLTSDDAADKYVAAYGARDRGTGQRFINAMGDQANVPNMFDAQQFLTKYRSTEGSKIYDPVLRGGQFNVSPEMDELLKVPAVKKAMEKVIADGAENGIEVGAAEAAHMVKQQLNKNVDAAFQSGNAVNKDFVRQIGDKWEQALWKANPAIKEADTAYAKVASLYDPKTGEGWLKRGSDFMKTGQGDAAVNVSPAALAADLPGATPEQMLVFRAGSSNVMRDAAMSGPETTRRLAKTISDNEIMQQKLTEIYGPARAQELMKRSMAEREYAASRGRVTAGSQTAERAAALARETALSPVPTSGGDLGRIWDFVKDTLAKTDRASGPVRSRLADLLANPNAAANAETLSLVEALLKRQAAAPRLSPGVAGAAGGAFSNSP